jgi:hemerythrin
MADILKWSEAYSVGHSKMDSQHKEILSLINILSNHPSSSVDSEEIYIVLDRLGRYARTHLEEEEALMMEICYPDVDEHKFLHSAFNEEYMKLVDAVIRHEKDATRNISSFLAKWWVKHIQKEDMKYKPYL